MNYRIFLSAIAILMISGPSFAQDYPYDANAKEGAPDNAANLPVEAPNPESPSQRVPKKVTSLFRMSLKAGGNFTFFQDRLCTSATSTGCTSYLNRSFSGPGFEGRIGFGWDLAYQPVYLETEFGYLQRMINVDSPLRVIQAQQGIFHRERIGKDTLWKNGVIAAIDVRIATTDDATMTAAVFPAFGLASIMEFGNFLIQLSVYASEIRISQNNVSGSLLTGLRF